MIPCSEAVQLKESNVRKRVAVQPPIQATASPGDRQCVLASIQVLRRDSSGFRFYTLAIIWVSHPCGDRCGGNQNHSYFSPALDRPRQKRNAAAACSICVPEEGLGRPPAGRRWTACWGGGFSPRRRSSGLLNHQKDCAGTNSLRVTGAESGCTLQQLDNGSETAPPPKPGRARSEAHTPATTGVLIPSSSWGRFG